MSISVTINEGTTFEITASFTDTSGSPVAPTIVEYRIDDVALGQEVRTWTSVTPADVVVIPIATTDTVILDNSRAYETRTVTVKASYGAGEQITESIDFMVKNMRFL